MGTAITGTDFKCGLSNKLYLVAVGFFINTPAAFEASMGEPPPIPTMKSDFCFLPSSAMFFTVSKDGFSSTLLKRSYIIPSLVNASVTSFNEPFMIEEVLPVIIKARFP